jgi:DNA-binding transcriptional regulator YhcF (GntR family)
MTSAAAGSGLAEVEAAERGSDGGFSLPPGRALSICLELQKAILEHRLRPGMKLSEDEVGEIFGASRTVVRAALHALAQSGLVTIERNRGAFVSRPTIREGHEVFEARALIEPRIARLAAAAVHNFHVQRILALPAETNPPLIVHADALLSLAVILQSFQAIPIRHAQILQTPRLMQQQQLSPRHPLNLRRRDWAGFQ